MEKWNAFWTAFGAIGTTLGAFATAAAVLISLKPYKKKFTTMFGIEAHGDGDTLYYLSVYNTGSSIYCENISLIYKRKIIVDCINYDMPLIIKSENEYKYEFDEQEIDAIKYHVREKDIKVLDVYVYDISGKAYRSKIDISWFNQIVKIKEG